MTRDVLLTELTNPLRLNQEADLPVLSTNLSAGALQLSQLHPLLTHRNLFHSVDLQGATDKGLAFSQNIEGHLKAAAGQVLENTNRRLQTDAQGRILFTKKNLYEGLAASYNKIVKASRFRGMAIQLASAQGLTVKLERIGFTADTAQLSINIYVYHQNSIPPVLTKAVPIERAHNFAWADLNIELSNADLGEGMYYVGYYEDDLVGSLLNKEQSFDKPCGTCNPQNNELYMTWTQAVSIHPFHINQEFTTDRNTLDTGKAMFKWDVTQGINLTLSAYCNLDNFWAGEQNKLTRLVGLQAVVNLLNVLGNSLNHNSLVKDLRDKALWELMERKDAGAPSVLLEEEYRSIVMGLQGLNPFCLPCKHQPVRYTNRAA